MDELSKDKQFEEISSIFNLDETFETAKQGVAKKEPSGKDDFEIDFSSVNKMESKVGTSYTFMIKNDEETPKHFENFVVEKHNNGTISGFIVYYEYSQRYMDSLKKGIVIPFDGTLRRTANKENLEELKAFFNGEKTAKSSTTAKSSAINCTETRYVTQSLCPTGEHSNGQYCFVTQGIWYGYYLQTVISCMDTNTWGWVGDSQSYTSSLPDPNVSSGGGSYSSTATVQPSLFSDVSTIQPFVNTYGLTGKEVEWARYIPNRNIVNNYMDDNDYTPLAKATVKNVISQIVANTTLKIDFVASLNSPINIDKLAVINTTPEGAMFNQVYLALTQSPEFKKLFLDIFDNSARFNVKFLIVDHVYEDNDSAKKEVNATTTQDPVTKNITIRISKQIFAPDGTRSQTKIENAKTILHECIHAYLLVMTSYPLVGKDIAAVMNQILPTPNEQHTFMYNKMIPTMQTVLSQIRDLVTTTGGRTYVEQLTMHPTTNPLTSTPWSWIDYYKYVSINGLEEANSFKVDFPKDTDQWNLYVNYVKYGHDFLKP